MTTRLDLIAYRLRCQRLQAALTTLHAGITADPDADADHREQLGNAVMALDDVLHYLHEAQAAQDARKDDQG